MYCRRATVYFLSGGIYDLTFPLNESQLPFFERSSSADKERVAYESNHFIPLEEAVPYASDWLRKRLMRTDAEAR